MSRTENHSAKITTRTGGIAYGFYDNRARQLRSATFANIFKMLRSAATVKTRVLPRGATTHPCS